MIGSMAKEIEQVYVAHYGDKQSGLEVTEGSDVLKPKE
jgi:hypothetical protein